MRDHVQFHALLKENESFEKLDLSGWIVLSNLIGPGDEIIISHKDCPLWDRDVRAVVHGVSSINTVAITVLTHDAKDRWGKEWTGEIPGWVDIMWGSYLITKPSVEPRILTLVRGDNKTWMLQGPFTIALEKETDTHWFGKQVDNPRKRVWRKDEWREKQR